MKKIKITIFILLITYLPVAAKTTEWIPFDLKNGLIILKVKVKGHEIKAMFDTGAHRSMIDKDMAKKIGIRARKRVTVHGVAGKTTSKAGYKVYVYLMKTKIKLSPVDIFDFQKENKSKFDMILGADYLKKMGVVRIDYKNRKIRFVDFKEKKKKEGERIPLHVSSKKIYTKAIANKRKKIRLIIDTGNNGSIFLKHKTAYKLGLTKNPGKASKSMGITKEFDAYSGKLNSLKLGKLELKEINVHFPKKDKKLKFNKSNYDGLLGYDILKNYLVTIDMKKKTMYLLENR